MADKDKNVRKAASSSETVKNASAGNLGGRNGGNDVNGSENEVREAAALRYSPGENKAPKLVAAGKGEIAKKIIETAENNDIPVYEDARLVHTLNRLQLGDEIPPELYEVVAEILVFVSNLDKSFGEKYGIIQGKK